jgi:hypothetical protein
MCDGQSTVNLTSGQWSINSHEGFSIASLKQQCERVPLDIFSAFLSSSFIFVHLRIKPVLSVNVSQVCILSHLCNLVNPYKLHVVWHICPSVCPSIRSSFSPSIFREKQASGSGHQVSSIPRYTYPVCASDWATTASMYFPSHSLLRVLLDAV